MDEQLSDKVQTTFDVSKIVCRHYADGFCRHGCYCFLPHVGITKRNRDNVCRYFLNRNCSFGARCTFDHVHFKTENGKTMLHLDPPQVEERMAAVRQSTPAEQRAATCKIEMTIEKEFWDKLRTVKERTVEIDNMKQIRSNYITANYDLMFPPLSGNSQHPEGKKTSGRLKTSKELRFFQRSSMYPSPVEYPNFDFIQNNFPCHPIDLTPNDLFNVFKYRAQVLQEEKSRNSVVTNDGTQGSSKIDSLCDIAQYITTSDEVSENEDVDDGYVREGDDSDWKYFQTENNLNRSGIPRAASMETPIGWYDYAWNYFKQKMKVQRNVSAERKR